MRLAYVFNFGGGGGASTQAWMLARAFQQVGIEVFCVNATEQGLMEPMVVEINGLPIVYTSTVVDAILKVNPDVVMVHSYNAGFIPYIHEALPPKVKFGVRCGSNLLEYHITQVVQQSPRWQCDLLTEYRRCDFVVSPSKYHTRQLQWLYDDKLNIYTIPVGVPTKQFLPTRFKDGGKLRVLIACRHAPNNWTAGMLAVLRKMEDVEVDVIGMSVMAYDAVIRYLIDKWKMKHVRYHGWVDELERMKFFEMADVVLVPSIAHNGVPVSVLEAMAAGNVVIASDVPVMKEVQAPIRVRLDDLQAWWKALRKVDDHEVWAKKKIAKGLEEVKKYDISKVTMEYVRMFHEVVEK